MNSFIFALQFLTRLPITWQYEIDEATQRQSFYWHGVVGLVIGLLLFSLHWLCDLVFANSVWLQGAILLIAWVMITGALHLDGLGDSADAWLGGHGNTAKTLSIMKDPTSGPAAIVWITLILLLKLGALISLLQAGLASALIFAPWIARLASMVLFVNTPYVRKSGLASGFADHVKPEWVYLQALILVIALWMVSGAQTVSVVVVVTLCWFGLRHLMIKRIKGTTGDTAGALIECNEACALIGFLAQL